MAGRQGQGPEAAREWEPFKATTERGMAMGEAEPLTTRQEGACVEKRRTGGLTHHRPGQARINRAHTARQQHA